MIGPAPRKLVPWEPTPLWQTRGLLLFPVTACAFFYGVTVAIAPSPAPPPMIKPMGPPTVVQIGTDRVSATIHASINPQGAPTQWMVEWAREGEAGYPNKTRSDDVGSGPSDVDVSSDLINLPVHSKIRYRLTATNSGSPDEYGRGSTHTDDFILDTGAAVQAVPTTQTYGAVWLSWSQWAGVALLFMAMCSAIRMMPGYHRGWASGVVVALFIWFNPVLLVDSVVWPQWEVWVLPPLLLAGLLATLDYWFLVGLVMGVGAMFKGQFLVGSPVLIMWPLLSMRWGALGRLVSGFVLSAGLILSPWLVLSSRLPVWNTGPLRWMQCVMAAALIVAVATAYRGWLRRLFVDLWRDTLARWNERSTPALAPVGASRALGSTSSSEDHPFNSNGNGDGDHGGNGDSPVLAGSGNGGGVAVATAPARAAVAPIVEPKLSPQRAHASILALIGFCLVLPTAVVFATLLVMRGWPGDADLAKSYGLYLMLLILIPPWFLKRSSLGVWMAAILGTSIWMSSMLFHGDWSWKTVGFEYGTRKFDKIATGEGSNGNLGAILARRGWDIHDVAYTVRLPDLAGKLHLATRDATGHFTGWVHDYGLDGTPVPLDLKQFLITVFAVLLMLCGIGAAIQSKRNHPRFLAALVAPWALMPNTLCQMMCRYQSWGAVLSALLIAVSSGFGFVHVAMSLLAAGMIGNQLLARDIGRSPNVRTIISGLSPDDGWIMIFSALLILATALTPGRRARK
jgi:hypothetical protein